MTLPLILEGTWEELAAQADQFRGHRLQLIVLPDKSTHEVDEAEQNRLREAMMELLDDVDSIEREPGKPLTDPCEAEYGRIIEEKYREMGFIV